MAEKPNNAIQRETRKTVSALLVSLDQRTV